MKVQPQEKADYWLCGIEERPIRIRGQGVIIFLLCLILTIQIAPYALMAYGFYKSHSVLTKLLEVKPAESK